MKINKFYKSASQKHFNKTLLGPWRWLVQKNTCHTSMKTSVWIPSTNIKKLGIVDCTCHPRTGEAGTKRALGLAKLVCSKSSEEMLSQKDKVGPEEGTQLVEVLGSKSHDLTLNWDPWGPTWWKEPTHMSCFQTCTVVLWFTHPHKSINVAKWRATEEDTQDWPLVSATVCTHEHVHMCHTQNCAPS